MTLTELSAKLEAATRPNRKLDAQLHMATVSKYIDWSAEINPQPIDLADGNYVPNYTSSLDAAVALVEKVLPGRPWQAGTMDGACIWESRDQKYYGSQVEAESFAEDGNQQNPALALCLALVRALIKKEKI